MAEKDTVTKKYMEDTAHFADAFNFFLYNGEERIKPEQLHELDTTAIAISLNSDRVSLIQKQRDVLKSMTAMSDGENAYLILGIENQSEIDYTMPVRVMLYDALQLNSQTETIKKNHRQNKDGNPTSAEWLSGWYKTDTLIPVITLVIYFGEDDWNAPRSLHEMMRIKNKEITKNVQDYHIRLIAPNEISDEEFDKFHTGLREILKYIKYCKDKNKLLQITNEDKAFHNVDRETALTINTVTNSNLKIPDEKECIDMCKAIKDMVMDAKMEGRMEAKTDSIVNIMQSLNLTFEQAFSALKLPEEMEDEYRTMTKEILSLNELN